MPPNPHPELPPTVSLAEIGVATARLRSGGLVAFPTETVYGLGADALNERAVAKVFAAKGRPANNPLIVHVTGPDMARSVAGAWPEQAAMLARGFWPGPLTIVVPAGPALPRVVTGGGETVAVRAPDHPTAMALLFAFGGPLVGPSANRSGGVSPTCAAHVREAFAEDVALTLDGGTCATGIESTVVSVVDPAGPVVLRPGIIGPDALTRVLGISVRTRGLEAAVSKGAMPSPGMLEQHYAPATLAWMFESAQWEEIASIADVAGRRIALFSHVERAVPSGWLRLILPADGAAYAAVLYSALREADGHHPEMILVERPPDAGSPAWVAVSDRLRRATQPFDPAVLRRD